MTELWTNSSPTSEFVSQTVSITDATDYKFFILVFMQSTSSNLSFTQSLIKGININLNVPLEISNSLVIYSYSRTINLSNSSLTITNCLQKATNATTASVTNNGMLIPYKLIGFK